MRIPSAFLRDGIVSRTGIVSLFHFDNYTTAARRSGTEVAVEDPFSNFALFRPIPNNARAAEVFDGIKSYHDTAINFVYAALSVELVGGE